MDSLLEKSLSEREKALRKAASIFEEKVVPCFARLENALDLGTGNGFTTFTLAKHFKEVISIDTNSKTLTLVEKKARENGVKNVQFKTMDAHDLQFADEHFDVITCRAAIHHFEDGDKVIKEVYRVLKQNGIFVIMDFCFSELAKESLAILSKIREDDFKRYYTFHEYLDLLDNNGFEIISMQTYTLPRSIAEWTAVAPEAIRPQLVKAFQSLDSRIHKELRIQQMEGKEFMIYRILEMITHKRETIEL